MTINTQNQAVDNRPVKEYHDHHTYGEGFLNKAVLITPSKGQPYFVCGINALIGKKGSKESIRFECSIPAENALELVQRFAPDVQAKKAVYITFKIGDAYPETFTYSEAHAKAGQTGVCMRGRLLRIFYLSVNGVIQYKAEKKETETVQQLSANKVSASAPFNEKPLEIETQAA